MQRTDGRTTSYVVDSYKLFYIIRKLYFNVTYLTDGAMKMKMKRMHCAMLVGQEREAELNSKTNYHLLEGYSTWYSEIRRLYLTSFNSYEI